jgi:antitoxin component of MazEF toxin-antitoxin module
MITLPVEQDDEGYYLTFTDDLLEELGWAIGDELNWDVQDDGTIIVTKHYDETTSTDRLECPVAQVQECSVEIGSPIHDC